MKKAIIVAVAVVVLAGIVAASVMKARAGGRGTKVYAEGAERREIARIVKASGQIDPRVKVSVSAHVVAKIDKLYVEEGDLVERGQPFLELEKQAFLAAAQQAEAQLQIARTQQRQAEVDREDSRLKLRRMERLAAESIAAEEQLEAAQLAATSSRLRVEQAREAVRQAQASLDKARDDLSKATLYSPLSGRVITLNAEEGEVVISGTMHNAASVIGVVADLSEILAEVNVDETDIVHVALGQSTEVHVDAIPDQVYRGEVVEIGSSGFNRPQQPDVTFFKTKVLLQEPDERLRPGMSARAEIEVVTHAEALVVPIQAVMYRKPRDEEGETIEDAEETRVAFRVVDGKSRQVAVEVGISDATHAEILSGLEEGDEVVTGPQRVLKDLEDGDEVRVEEEQEDEEE